ncbi:hypothetical protein GCM10009610_65310 [Pseudonocardia xinjiangensis]
MTRTLLLGARVLDPGGAADAAEAVEISADRISFVGTAAQARERLRGSDGGVVVLDLDGAVVTPAFVDAHVHATATGLLVDGVDLTGCPSPGALPGRGHWSGATAGRTSTGRNRCRRGRSSTAPRAAPRCT